MKLFFYIILSTISVFASANNANHKAIYKIIETAVQNDRFNGAVLVADTSQVIFQNAFGYANSDKSEKLTLEHRFNIGSISKEFPALLLNNLLQKNKTSLNQPLSDYVKDLPPWANKIQIQHLLNYSSGLPDFPWTPGVKNEDAINSLKKITTLNSAPGTEYYYSYYNNFLLALVIENITNKRFDQLLNNEIFLPLKMHKTENSLNKPLGSIATARAFGVDGKEDDFPAFVTGPSIYSTVNDLFNWTQSLNNNSLIDQVSLNRLMKPFSLETNSDGFTLQQSAFGSIKYKDDSVVAIFHNGSHLNFHSILYIDKLKNRTILILSNNKANSKIFDLSNSILEILDK